MKIFIIIFYILAIISANFIALYIGQKGLIITAFLLVPFDFTLRSYFHETWKNNKLLINLSILIITASGITYFLNQNTINIAIGSSVAFLLSNIFASIYYQININKSFFNKVNISDFVGIIIDSFIFQLIAFNNISTSVMSAQILIKILGGLFWYWVIFKKIKLQDKW
jgi:uncharacterized PurR-regulated membrane protein YhhQ (DUF165 family)